MTYLRALILLLLTFTAVAEAPANKVYSFGTGVIWGMDFLDENQMVVTRRTGELDLIDLNTGKQQSLNAPTVRAKGQGGLLDIKVRRQDKQTYLYVTYSKKLEKGSTTALARAEYKPGQTLQWQDLFPPKPQNPFFLTSGCFSPGIRSFLV